MSDTQSSAGIPITSHEVRRHGSLEPRDRAANAFDVLLLDDDDSLHTVPAEGLREDGFEVAEAEDGSEALNALRHARPGTVFVVDKNLPSRCGMRDGLAVAAEARALRPELRIVFITGQHDAFDDYALRPGEHVLLKPFSIRRLVELVEKLRPE